MISRERLIRFHSTNAICIIYKFHMPIGYFDVEPRLVMPEDGCDGSSAPSLGLDNYLSSLTSYTTTGGNMSNCSISGCLMSNDMVMNFLRYEYTTRQFDPISEIILIVIFSIVILFGSVGNGLVGYVVARNSHMRTPRNIFIINLAISDLTLCVFTQPFNLVKLLSVEWSFGEFMCKFVPMFQGTNVFVSTISITAIALDRFQVIVYPTKDSMRRIGAAAALITIWLISFLMASPLLIFTFLKSDIPVLSLPFCIYRCIEDADLSTARGAYSIASVLVQYILPIMIVSVAHARICNKLRYRMVNQAGPTGGVRSPYRQKKNERETQRKRRTNILLAMIAFVFALSWMPLNLCNILLEFNVSQTLNANSSLVFVICHMLALSSACLNPVLYGWLNENFRTEFIKVLCSHRCLSFRHKLRAACCRSAGEQVGTGTQCVPVIVLTKESNGLQVPIEHEEDGMCLQVSMVSQMPSSTDFV